MPRYIDAKITLKTIDKAIADYTEHDDVLRFLSDLRLAVLDAPTADVEEVRHGHWNKTCVPDIYQCDVCKRPVKMDELCDSEVMREYCPKCGAKMDGEELNK